MSKKNNDLTLHIMWCFILLSICLFFAFACEEPNLNSDNEATEMMRVDLSGLDQALPDHQDQTISSLDSSILPDQDIQQEDLSVPSPDLFMSPDSDPNDPEAPLDLPCNTAITPLSPDLNLEELFWDDEEGVATVGTQEWVIAGEPIAEAHLHEAVRFDIKHPAKIHAIRVQYGILPRFRNWPIALNIYKDFGYNGFDFWTETPLWEGTRCRGDAQLGEWLTFTLDEPIEIEHPGLVYVGHQREYPDDPAFLFDGTQPESCESGADNCCAAFEECHSAWNFPTVTLLDGTPFWKGLSTSFRYDYLVRLQVEYLEQVTPEEKLFQPIEGDNTSNRMAWGDYDNDGDDDLLINGPRLMKNEDGTFEDATEESGLASLNVAGSGVWGDYDNDGCLDLFLFEESYTRGEALLRSDCEGGFEDMTAHSQLNDLQTYLLCGGEGSDHAPTPAAAWVDLDSDGFLDLYLANFICWDQGASYIDQVWHNEGDGTFSEWTGTRGFAELESTPFASRGVNPMDVDQDGDVDLFVNNYRLHPNLFYQNQGDGVVVEAGESLGLRGHESTRGISRSYGHSIGAAWGDLNEDGRFDLVVANLAHPRFFDFSDKTQVMIQGEDGVFTDIQGSFDEPHGEAGLRYQETHSVPILADFDQDGHLDLVISAVYDGRPSDFYWGRGDGTFRLDQYHSGVDVENGWGMATADLDFDGDLDLATSKILYQNTQSTGGGWLQVKVVGDDGSNRAAIGATVRVFIGDRVLLRGVGGGTNQGCQDSLYLHFGLGDQTQVDAIEVRFPGNKLMRYEGPFDSNQRLWLYESGTLERGRVARF